MPLSSLVDKVLESKAKELLPKISEVVDKLRESKTKGSPSIPDPSSSSGNSAGQTADKNTLDVLSKPKSTDFGSLPLPIDIPGLTSSTGGSSTAPSNKKESSEGKVPLKSKSKASDVNVKENKTKGKAGQPKVPTIAKESLKKEKEVVNERDTATEEGGKEKDKHKSTTKLKKAKDDVKDKGMSVHKERAQDGKAGVSEKPDDAKDKGAGVRIDKPNVIEKPDDIKDKGGRDRSQDGKPGSTEKTDQESHADSKIGKGLPMNESKRDTGAEIAESEAQSDPKKVLPPRRRSARIASLSEDNGKEEGDSREKPCEEEAVDNQNMSEEAVKANSSSSKTKRKRKQKALKNESQKKRQRLLSSSTDEELEIQECISSEEEPEDNGKYASKVKSKQRDSHAQDTYTQKRAKKRALQQVAEDSSVSVPQKKSRRLSKSNDGPTTQAKAAAADHTPPSEENIPKPHRRKSSQPQRLPVRSSKSPPVIITRYNRQIKPNRRYLDTSGEASEAGSEGEGEADEEKRNPQDSEEVYTDIDSSDSEHEHES